MFPHLLDYPQCCILDLVVGLIENFCIYWYFFTRHESSPVNEVLIHPDFSKINPSLPSLLKELLIPIPGYGDSS